MNTKFLVSLAIGTFGILTANAALADVCDYKPSALIGGASAMTAATATGTLTGAGIGMKAAGYYTLVHAGSGLTMLGSTAAGASAAGTVGILAGTGGVLGAVGGFIMAPITLIVGGATLAVGGAYEGVCYFYVERVTDPYHVRQIIENVALLDPMIEIVLSPDGDAMRIKTDEGFEDYVLRNLYIADGDLMFRKRFLDKNLGPIVYVTDEVQE